MVVEYEVQQFEEREGGFKVFVEVDENGPVIEKILRQVRRSVPNVAPNETITLCCYEFGERKRTNLTSDEQFRSLTLKSRVIYFWTGAGSAPPSLDTKGLIQTVHQVQRRQEELEMQLEEQREELEMQLEEQRGQIMLLQCTSMDTRQRSDLWDKKKFFPREEVDALRRNGTAPKLNYENIFQLISATNVTEEADVQKLWVGLFAELIQYSGRNWVDCTAPNGITYMSRNHDIDLALFCGAAVAMEYLDIPVELKDNISTNAKKRDVVLQILERITYSTQAQPERKVFWGIGMDKANYTVVKCLKNLDYFVSPIFKLESSSDVQKLAELLNTPFGYVRVAMPSPFGLNVFSQLASGKHADVFALDGGGVLKAYKGGDSQLSNELNVLKQLKEHPQAKLAPLLIEEYNTDEEAEYTRGFTMTRYQPVNPSNENCLLRLLQVVFWRLTFLHHSFHVNHGDVKPDNILESHVEEMPVDYLLCDFGHAYSIELDGGNRGATPMFASIPDLFEECRTSVEQRDIESLYWTILFLWLKLHGLKLQVDCRTDVRDLLKSSGGLLNSSLRKVSVENDDLRAFLTCDVLPSRASVIASDIGEAGITKASCPHDLRASLFPGETEDT